MAKAALLTVHGTGRVPRDYNKDLCKQIESRLGSSFSDLYIGSIYYKDILQESEERVWESCSGHVRWDVLRQFILYGFGDAAGLEARKESFDSPYSLVQRRVAHELFKAKIAMGGNGPVVIIAESLGCQVISCFIWDAIKYRDGQKPATGIWQYIYQFNQEIMGKAALTYEDRIFLWGDTIRSLITTGCNIPIFVAGHARESIRPIRLNCQFTWDNYYDEDDVLGWPLACLSREYEEVVTDHKVHCGDDAINWIQKNWSPLSYSLYWNDDSVLEGLTQRLREALA